MLAEFTGAGVPSEEQLLDWLRAAPRTLRWDAIAAYDRVRTNQILMQDYIKRFNGVSLLPPVTASVEIVPGTHWQHLYDYRMDAPRLSFERSGFDRSECRLTMRIAGGTELVVMKNLGQRDRRVVRVDWIDALQGPRLLAKVNLVAAKATLTTAGKVQLDLSSATQFELTSLDTQAGRRLGGAFFEELFGRLPGAKRVFVLTSLGKGDGRDIFRTGELKVRVFPAPGSARRGAVEYGDGAVVMFVASKDGAAGNLPSSTSGWLYPIPAGQSTTLLVGHHFLLRRLLNDGAVAATGNGRLAFDNTTNLEAPVGAIRLDASTVRGLGTFYDPPSSFTKLFCMIPTLPVRDVPGVGTGSFSVQLKNGQLAFAWVGAIGQLLDSSLVVSTESPSGTSAFNASWSISDGFRFIHTADGALAVAKASGGAAEYAVELRSQSTGHAAHAATIRDRARSHLEAAAECTLNTLLSPCHEIDIFRSRGLLFESDSTVVLDSVHFPMDLACFGHLAPAVASFAVEPLEVKVGAGNQQQFRVLPAQSNVSWTVAAVDDPTAPLGQISSAGIYVAPAASTIPGTQLLVRVSASANGRSTSALVRVLKRELVINPLVAITALAGPRVRLSAGALDGTPLTWSLKTRTGARLEPIPFDSDLEFEPGDHYYVPGPEQSSSEFVVLDEVTVTHPVTRATHSSCIAVFMKLMAAEARMVRPPGMPANQVKMELWNGDGPIEAPTWTLISGGGTIDSATGIYTADALSPHRFAVILGVKSAYGFSMADCLILPVPLLDLETIGRIAHPSASPLTTLEQEH